MRTLPDVADFNSEMNWWISLGCIELSNSSIAGVPAAERLLKSSCEAFGFSMRVSGYLTNCPFSYGNTAAPHAFPPREQFPGDVARRIGYDSDAAFSRAFKAQFGMAPVLARQLDQRGA